MRGETQRAGAKVWFADEAYLRAEGDLRGKWPLRGQPALVDSSSPAGREGPSCYSAVCLEAGEVAAMELAGNSTVPTSAVFLQRLRSSCPEPLVVIWDNGPAHRGAAIRQYLATPELRLRLVSLPPYSPDFNGDEAIWKWARAEVMANTCLGSIAQLCEKLGVFFQGLAARCDEVKRRCRTALQAQLERLVTGSLEPTAHVDPTLALV